MWLLVQGRIKSCSVLHKKKICDDQTCEVCNQADETPDHIIGRCGNAVLFWQRLNLNSVVGVQVASIHTVALDGGVPRDEFSAFLSLCCWQLWKSRNAKVFRQQTLSVSDILTNCNTAAEQWRFRMSRRNKHISYVWCQLGASCLKWLDKARAKDLPFFTSSGFALCFVVTVLVTIVIKISKYQETVLGPI